MKKHSLCFIIFLLLLSGFLGSVMGSLMDTIFGIQFLNYELLPQKGIQLQNFYIIKNLQLQITPSTLVGIGVALFLLFKYGNAT